MKKKILIMYATYGNGHKSIANYINDYFSSTGEYETMVIDILDYTNKRFGDFTSKFYDFTMKYTPFLWEVLYRAADNKPVGKVGAKALSQVVSNKKIKKTILDFNPDMVIATHFTAATYISKLVKNGELSTSLISVVTDYKAHQIWLDSVKTEDALIVNSTEEKRKLIRKGVNPSIIKTFGIPISTNYTMSLYDKASLLKKLKFTGIRPIIVFYAGHSSYSLTYLLAMIESKIDADIVFICGRDEKIKKQADSLVKRTGATNVRVTGFVNNGAEYVFVADFVITKPGGITVTECMCFKKPMVLIRGNGGQETDNYRFLVKKGYAIHASWMIKFTHVIKKLTSDTRIIDNMEKNFDKLNKEDAMKKLYKLVGEIIEEKKNK